MARSAQPINPTLGIGVAVLVSGLILLAFGGVMSRATDAGSLAAADWAAIRFTIWQAILSALISVTLAVPLARALSRRNFAGRRWLITLLGAPFLLPVMVAVLGLLAIFGNKGWLNLGLDALGFESVSIYGAHGVILAHVFFNLPLATRLILQGWQNIPSEHFRLAANLRVKSLFWLLEWPMLRQVVPGALGLVFVICLTSFAVALILGGGPKATTIELAIYQAFRFQFDLGRAALLSIMQMGIALTACFALFRVLPMHDPALGMDRVQRRWDQSRLDPWLILLGTLFLVLPMISILGQGVPGLIDLPLTVWQATLRSIMVALASTALLLFLSLPLAVLILRAGGAEAAAILGLATSPLMLGTGLFIVVFPFANPVDLALVVTCLVNAIMALPFAVRVLVPSLRDAVQTYGRLSASLGLTGWALWRIVLLPRLRRPLGFALGLGAALSMGDLGVIALFADPIRATLPLQIEQLLAAYRIEQAASASLVLTAVSFALFGLFDAWGRARA
ncbi:MAG: thiamine/thiamine pyrophosphate ABC transporter permease ThiP [Paracoccaceae bacterium]